MPEKSNGFLLGYAVVDRGVESWSTARIITHNRGERWDADAGHHGIHSEEAAIADLQARLAENPVRVGLELW
jgi:hypothetical protein